MRRSFFRMTLPSLLLAAMLLLTGCGGIISSAEDIPGHSVGILTGSAAKYYAAHYETLGSAVITYDTPDQLAAAIAGGYVDCGITDSDNAAVCTKASRKVKILDGTFASAGYCVAVALENPVLLENINTVLTAMNESGELRSLVNTYSAGKTQSSKKAEDAPVCDHTLTVAVDDTLSTFAFRNESGELDGLDVAIAKAIGKQLEVNITFITAPSADLMEEVRKGNADFALGALVSTEETAELVLLSAPYMEVTQALLVRK